VFINGGEVEIADPSDGFIKIERKFSHNDNIHLRLPMEVGISHWPRGGLGIEYGPLVYSLRIEEDWHVVQDPKSSPDFPAWDLHATSPWNYALVLDERQPCKDVELISRPLTSDPWNIHNAPIELRVLARRVSGWSLDERTTIIDHTYTGKGKGKSKKGLINGNFIFTPQLPDPETLNMRLSENPERITLVPYGCSKLRITIFPHCESS
jgi:hypothetical protein